MINILEKKIKVLMIAGEPSGDIHGAVLMKSLKNMCSNIEFIGIGGTRMAEEGLTSLVALEDISVIGFIEVLKRGKLFINLVKKCKSIISKENIDLFIPIDYPGFNIKIAKYAREKNIPVYYYIAPQLWAWGKSRWQKLKNVVTKLLVVFPFEEKYFSEKNIPVEFVGHPLLDNPEFESPTIDFKNRENIVAFFPGSRKQEVLKNLELFAETARELSQKISDYKFEFAVSANLSNSDFDLLKKYNFNYKLNNNSILLMKKAKVGVVKAGTSTLEAALLGMNMIMAYKTSWTHYYIGKKIINLDYISLPNILLNKKIVDEYIQKDVSCGSLASKIIYMLKNSEFCEEQQDEYRNIRELLGNGGASEKAAKIILEKFL